MRSLPWEGGGRGLFWFDIVETPPYHCTGNRTPPVGRELEKVLFLLQIQ